MRVESEKLPEANFGAQGTFKGAIHVLSERYG